MSTFGQPAAAGAFGAPAAAPASSSFSFGTQSGNTGSMFGTSASGFGSAAPAPNAGFGFGGSTAPSASTALNFGAPAASTGSTGFGFGAPAAPTGSTGFGFGAPAAPTGSTGFGFGAPAASTGSNGFGFGAPAASTGSTGLGFGAPAASTGGFGGFGASTTSAPSFGGFSGFGANPIASSAPSFGGPNFGNTLGSNTLPGAGTFGFGGSQQQQQQQQQQPNSLYSALLNVAIYGDERDAILSRWNQLQARWGVGKGFYSANAPPVVFTADNAFCTMKTVGFARLPTTKDSDGLVALCFNKSLTELKSGQQSVVECVGRVLGSRPNLSVCVDSVQSIAADKSELHIYVQERNQIGAVRRVPATELHAHLATPMPRSQLTASAVADLYPVTGPSSQQLSLYLENPPADIDPVIWEQAKKDNPDPKSMVPVPVVGFQELHRKIQRQVEENDAQQRRLDLIAEDISALQRCQATANAKLSHLKRQNTVLTHRLIKVLVRQEVLRKQGWSIQPDEESLRVQLESIKAELSTPTQFKGRLNELLSRARLQWQQPAGASGAERCSIGGQQLLDIEQLLAAEQLAVQQLVKLVQTDLVDLQSLEQQLVDSSRR